MSIDQRVETVEEAILIMKNLLLTHNDRLDDYFESFNRERSKQEKFNEDFNFKLNALVDTQIRNEDYIVNLKDSIIEVKEAIIEDRKSITEKEASIELRMASTQLNEASQSQLGRIENLENKKINE